MCEKADDLVNIRTDHGLWRDNARGYTTNQAEAGRWRRDEAQRMTRHLGPEKYLQIIPAPTQGEGSEPVRWREALDELESIANRLEQIAGSDTEPSRDFEKWRYKFNAVRIAAHAPPPLPAANADLAQSDAHRHIESWRRLARRLEAENTQLKKELRLVSPFAESAKTAGNADPRVREALDKLVVEHEAHQLATRVIPAALIFADEAEHIEHARNKAAEILKPYVAALRTYAGESAAQSEPAPDASMTNADWLRAISAWAPQYADHLEEAADELDELRAARRI